MGECIELGRKPTWTLHLHLLLGFLVVCVIIISLNPFAKLFGSKVLNRSRITQESVRNPGNSMIHCCGIIAESQEA